MCGEGWLVEDRLYSLHAAPDRGPIDDRAHVGGKQGGKDVESYDLVSQAFQPANQGLAQVTGASCNQNFHARVTFSASGNPRALQPIAGRQTESSPCTGVPPNSGVSLHPPWKSWKSPKLLAGLFPRKIITNVRMRLRTLGPRPDPDPMATASTSRAPARLASQDSRFDRRLAEILDYAT